MNDLSDELRDIYNNYYGRTREEDLEIGNRLAPARALSLDMLTRFYEFALKPATDKEFSEWVKHLEMMKPLARVAQIYYEVSGNPLNVAAAEAYTFMLDRATELLKCYKEEV